jgi:mRNA-degrading endonuclease YafQ of YafQ-DinJ toxin-antitoxin module
MSVTGSPLYSIEKSDFFERTFKKLAKPYHRDSLDRLLDAIEGLTKNPYPLKSREEPLPSKTLMPNSWTFHKLEIWVSKGASGQVRLMYLVNEESQLIKLLWIYNHEQFAKRPDDRDLRESIDIALNPETTESQDDET